MYSSVSTIWVLLGAALVFLMQAGFAMCEAGFTRAKSLFNISTCMDWRVDFLPCKAKIRRHPDGWQGFLTQSGRKIRRQDMRGEILNRL